MWLCGRDRTAISHKLNTRQGHDVGPKSLMHPFDYIYEVSTLRMEQALLSFSLVLLQLRSVFKLRRLTIHHTVLIRTLFRMKQTVGVNEAWKIGISEGSWANWSLWTNCSQLTSNKRDFLKAHLAVSISFQFTCLVIFQKIPNSNTSFLVKPNCFSLKVLLLCKCMVVALSLFRENLFYAS